MICNSSQVIKEGSIVVPTLTTPSVLNKTKNSIPNDIAANEVSKVASPICSECEAKESILKCVDCPSHISFFCSDCAAQHVKPKMARNHRIIPCSEKDYEIAFGKESQHLSSSKPENEHKRKYKSFSIVDEFPAESDNISVEIKRMRDFMNNKFEWHNLAYTQSHFVKVYRCALHQDCPHKFKIEVKDKRVILSECETHAPNIVQRAEIQGKSRGLHFAVKAKAKQMFLEGMSPSEAMTTLSKICSDQLDVPPPTSSQLKNAKYYAIKGKLKSISKKILECSKGISSPVVDDLVAVAATLTGTAIGTGTATGTGTGTVTQQSVVSKKAKTMTTTTTTITTTGSSNSSSSSLFPSPTPTSSLPANKSIVPSEHTRSEGLPITTPSPPVPVLVPVVGATVEL
eukprot:gene13969-29738_t